MQIIRIRVPAFRVLRDVDITFEPEFAPRVFPLGSLNGGGKSTLLQLVFVLLHCTPFEERWPLLRHMLGHFNHPADQPEVPVATIDVRHDGHVYCIKFRSYNQRFFDTSTDEPVALETLIERDRVLALYGDTPFPDWPDSVQKHMNAVQNQWRSIDQALATHGSEYITYYEPARITTEHKAALSVLGCRIEAQSEELHEELDSDVILEGIAERVFLSSPNSAMHLFLSPESSAQVFQHAGAYVEYQQAIQSAEQKLPNFSAVGFLALKQLPAYFAHATQLDIAEKVQTGSYGHYYDTALEQINQLLAPKTVTPTSDLTAVIFALQQGEEEISLSPQDLSHGELKRLLLFAWLKARGIEDSVVLIDEIENALHPDWQYNIVSDLQAWAPSNQYILATHSYELCQAVTPSHVKELSPPLPYRPDQPGSESAPDDERG